MSRGSSGSKKYAGGGLGSKIKMSMGAVLLLVTLLAGYSLYTLITLPQPAARPVTSPAAQNVKSGQIPGKASSILQEARAIEQAFRKEQTPASVVQFEEAGKKLLAHALDLGKKTQGKDRKDAPAGTQLSQLVSRYNASFHELVQAWEVKGINDDSGLRLKLKEAAQNLTAAPTVPGAKNQWLTEALLKLGRAEQNYFAAPGVENQRLLAAAANELAEAALKSGLPAPELQAIQTGINNYLTAFDRYLAVSLTTNDPALAASFAAEQIKQEEAMHQAALNLEKLHSTLGPSRDENSLQTLRQQEEAYLKQGDAAGAALVAKMLEEALNALDSSAPPDARKNAMKSVILENQAAFAALVEQNRIIAALEADVDNNFAALEKQITASAPKVSLPAPSPPPTAGRVPMLSLAVIAGSWLATVLVLLFISRKLTASLAAPLQRMTDIAHRMAAQGDPNLAFPLEKNEFDGLAGALNILYRQQTANAGGSEDLLASLSQNTGHLSRCLRDKAEHEGQLTGSFLQQKEVANQVSTVVDRLRTDTEQMQYLTDGLSEQKGNLQQALTGCEQSINNAIDTLSNLSLPAGEIAQIVNAFTELTEQTSVMALNAAIKASRAGVPDKELSSATEELDKLAKQAMQTARDVTRLLDDLNAGITGGEQAGHETRQALQHLAATATSCLGQIEELSNRASAIQTEVGETGALLAEFDQIGGRLHSLTREIEPLNGAIADGLAQLEALSRTPAEEEQPLEDMMKKILQDDQDDNAVQHLSTRAAGHGSQS
ncbi:MAG: methyl-accepting chemotaxis protein [Desulfobulbaceae bacterium]